MGRKRIAVITGLVLAVGTLTLGAWLMWGKSKESGGGWPTTKVALATVQNSPAPRSLRAVGELEALRQVEISAETAGRITHISFSSGQTVKPGQILVRINDGPEQAERLRLKAQLRNTQTILARARQMLTQQLISKEQYDNAQAEHDMAYATLQQIEAVIAQKTIRAPFAGIIGIRRVHDGQYLNAGDPIASLVDASTLNVNFSVDEQARPDLHTGQPLDVQVDAWPQRSFPATLTAIDPLIGNSRTVQVQARVPNTDGLLQAGMFANIRVLRQQPTSVLTVPETAVTYTAYGQTVFVAENHPPKGLSVRRVAVKTGERWEGRVEITSQLKAGDQVVVSGQIKLSDGMPVEAVAHDSLHNDPPVTLTTRSAQP